MFRYLVGRGFLPRPFVLRKRFGVEPRVRGRDNIFRQIPIMQMGSQLKPLAEGQRSV